MKTIFYNQGQVLVGIIIILIIVGLITGGLYFYLSNQIPKISEITEEPTQEKIVEPGEEVAEQEKEVIPPEEIIPDEEIVSTCQDECSQTGFKRCSGNGYQACGNYDVDNCLEWSSVIACPINTICQNGNCVQQKCSDGTSYSQCSTNKPKYCENGNLIDKCSICSCSLNYYCNKSSEMCELTEKNDMLIFISPQYRNDTQIRQAIDEYRNAIKKDIGWKTEIITITLDINDFRKIDEIIEEYSKKSRGNLKACLMVGEDIDTALSSEFSFKEAPSVTPWATLGKYQMIRNDEIITCGGVVGEEICEVRDKNSEELIEKFKQKDGRVLKYGAVVGGASDQLDIVISLLYPTHKLEYEIKSQQIVNTFKKFSRERNKIYPLKSLIFLDAITLTRTHQEKLNYQFLSNYTNLRYKEDPNKEEVLSSLKEEYILYATFGHAFPNAIYVNGSDSSARFEADFLDSLETPIFIGSGCYTHGWFSEVAEPNDKLDLSIARSWFGSKIFISSSLQTMILGGPNEGCDKEETCVFRKILTHLMEGKTLAESVIEADHEGLFYDLTSAITFYGDPTFHYNF